MVQKAAFMAYAVAFSFAIMCVNSVQSWDPYISQFMPRLQERRAVIPEPGQTGYVPDQASDRIFRGWFLKPHEFPWMVKLKVKLSSKLALGQCAGTSAVWHIAS